MDARSAPTLFQARENDPVRLTLYIGGVLQGRVVCAGQGRAPGSSCPADRGRGRRTGPLANDSYTGDLPYG